MTTTWSAISSTPFAAQAVCTSGTESAPSASTAGVALGSFAGRDVTLDVYVSADSGQTITDGNGFDLYFYEPAIARWAKYNATPYTVPTGGRDGYLQGDSPGKGIPILSRRGRAAVVPNGAAVSSGNITISMVVS